jgi:hypothetical protein
MKLKITIIGCTVILMGAASISSAQNQDYIHNRTVMERALVAGAGGTPVPLGNMSMSTPATVGDVYLTADYRITTFWLYNSNTMGQGYAVRLDLERNEFDILFGNGVRALTGTKVKTLMWLDSLTRTPQYFVNAQEYKNEEDVPFVGFFQILSEGELTLLKMTQVKFKPADKSLVHNTGTKDNKFLKIVDFYIAQGTKATKLPNRKGILKLMASHNDEVEKFMKVNEISTSNERHLVAVFDYYNSLIKK